MRQQRGEVRSLNVIRRGDLYDLVWSEPMRSAARRFGISDVALAKACRRHRIPVPGRGYWAKHAHGKAPRRARLPQLSESDALRLAEIRFAVRRSDISELMRSGESDPHLPVVVPPRLEHPLPIVRKSRAMLRRGAVRDGVLATDESPCLDVRVSKSSLDRAMRVLNALFLACADRGYAVSIAEEHPRGTTLVVDEERIGIRLEERIERAEKPRPKPTRLASWLPTPYHYPQYEYRPTRILKLRLLGLDYSGIRASWMDGKVQRVENCLADVIATLELGAEHLRRARLEMERRRQQWEEEVRQRVEAERLRREEQDREKELDDLACDWANAIRISEFVDAVRAAASQRGSVVATESALGHWLHWATERAERLNPIQELLDSARASSPAEAD